MLTNTVVVLTGILTCAKYTVRANNPTNCSMAEVLGDWTLYVKEPSANKEINCDNTRDEVNHHRKFKITLKGDGTAVQDGWVSGSWTMIFNEGFEINLGFYNYFAYFDYKQVGKNSFLSYCDVTWNGKAVDVQLRQFSCFYGKQNKSREEKQHESPTYNEQDKEMIKKEYLDNMINEVRQTNPSWEPCVYEAYRNMSFKQFRDFAGGERGYMPWRPPVKATEGWDSGNSSLDWRNVNGVNFISSPRHQNQCSSCYAFVATGLMQDRVRVLTKNKVQPIFSPQDVINCAPLTDGCSGGFPYKAAGRYGWETGLVEESCVPYQSKDMECIKVNCPRWYTAAYNFVGGYFGACSEKAMIEALKKGPIAVNIEINHDFYMYQSGVYSRPGGNFKIPPEHIAPVNHALIVVGYGVESKSGLKYWIAKNSWGPQWGENGYIRVLRGVNEIGIESVATEAFVIPRY